MHQLFLRKVNVFPPQGLDVEDNFFSRQRAPSDERWPGRLYLGICAPGRRLKAALIRVYVAYLASAQYLYERYGKDVDPWMTLAGYFNSLRELGGMRRLVDDDVSTRLGKTAQRGLARRHLRIVEELTSRVGSTQIPKTLDLLGVQFDPSRGRGRNAPTPIDVLLATNMISVGVDVPRLGLMVVGGQPKTTAEYIQATSRVGRRLPGVVCTVLNWARPRDLSHYEQFEHYHATFYKHVEALSVTPFASRAIDRGLTGVLASCVRQLSDEFNPNAAAEQIDQQHEIVRDAVRTLAHRAGLVECDTQAAALVESEMDARLDEWVARAADTTGGKRLGYRDRRDGVTLGLLKQPSLERWDHFTCLNSLRDVEPGVGLILDDHGLDEEPGPVAAPSVDADAGGGDRE